MSGELATIAKLSRVIFLVPIVLTLGLFSNKSTANNQVNKLPIPWFVLGFIALMLLNSLNIFPENIKGAVISFNHFLLAISMAGMGLKTSLFDIQKTGVKPFYLGAASWLFISMFSLGLIKIFY